MDITIYISMGMFFLVNCVRTLAKYLLQHKMVFAQVNLFDYSIIMETEDFCDIG